MDSSLPEMEGGSDAFFDEHYLWTFRR